MRFISVFTASIVTASCLSFSLFACGSSQDQSDGGTPAPSARSGSGDPLDGVTCDFLCEGYCEGLAECLGKAPPDCHDACVRGAERDGCRDVAGLRVLGCGPLLVDACERNVLDEGCGRFCESYCDAFCSFVASCDEAPGASECLASCSTLTEAECAGAEAPDRMTCAEALDDVRCGQYCEVLCQAGDACATLDVERCSAVCREVPMGPCNLASIELRSCDELKQEALCYEDGGLCFDDDAYGLCSGHFDCEETHFCDPGTGVCGRCLGDEDCAGNGALYGQAWVCEEGACLRVECTHGGICAHCTSTWDPVCQGGQCDVERGSCADYCLDSDECAAGHRCVELSCRPDPNALSCTASTAAGCGPYACEPEVGFCHARCSSSAQCSEGHACLASECVRECAGFSDPVCGGYLCEARTDTCASTCSSSADGCAAGHLCGPVGAGFEPRECLRAEDAQACTSDADCAPFSCGENGYCWTSCEQGDDAACAAGLRCSFDVCGLSCSEADAAKCGPYACRLDYLPAICLSSCESNVDCADGYRCELGACVESPTCSTLDDPVCGNYACDLLGGRCFTRCEDSDQCTGNTFTYCTVFGGECE